MTLDNFVGVIATVQQHIREHGTLLRANETRTRMALIDPLLTVLGWDVADPALVTPEYNVNGKLADYALLEGSTVVVFLEAKKLDEPLSKHRSQIVSYASELGIQFPALTNGDVWEVYDNSKLVPIEERRILDLSILDTPTHMCALQLLLLWRPNISSGTPVATEEPLVSLRPTSVPQSPQQETDLRSEHPPVGESDSGWCRLSSSVANVDDPVPVAIRFPDGEARDIQSWGYIVRHTCLGYLPMLGCQRKMCLSRPTTNVLSSTQNPFIQLDNLSDKVRQLRERHTSSIPRSVVRLW